MWKSGNLVWIPNFDIFQDQAEGQHIERNFAVPWARVKTGERDSMTARRIFRMRVWWQSLGIVVLGFALLSLRRNPWEMAGTVVTVLSGLVVYLIMKKQQ